MFIGNQAPNFVAQTVKSNGEIVEDYNLYDQTEDRYTVLFFYPMDFTFVCPTEIMAINNRISKFEELNTKVIGVSTDTHWTHLAWRNTPVSEGGIGEVKFDLVGDITKGVSDGYGVLCKGGEHDFSYYPPGVPVRATMILDKKKVVRHVTMNDEPLGRNLDETIRVIEALQFFEENGQVCPAGWQTGKEAFTPKSEEELKNYLQNNSEKL